MTRNMPLPRAFQYIIHIYGVGQKVTPFWVSSFVRCITIAICVYLRRPMFSLIIHSLNLLIYMKTFS